MKHFASQRVFVIYLLTGKTSLFDLKSYNEAIVNAVLHNKWVDGYEPMITVYSNRIEILLKN